MPGQTAPLENRLTLRSFHRPNHTSFFKLGRIRIRPTLLRTGWHWARG
jgi:hypothetical protein